MRRSGNKIVAATLAGALLLGSSAAVAQTAAPAPVQSSQVSWTTLSMLNAAGSAALAQGTTQPGPAPEAQQPAPPPGYEGNAYVGVPYPVIGVLLATFAMGVYI